MMGRRGEALVGSGRRRAASERQAHPLLPEPFDLPGLAVPPLPAPSLLQAPSEQEAPRQSAQSRLRASLCPLCSRTERIRARAALAIPSSAKRSVTGVAFG